MPVDSCQQFEFGPFCLDGRERLLLMEGTAIPLNGRTLDTLFALVRRGGHVVHKDELLREVWAGADIEENNLAQCISALRKVLHRKANASHYIETIPGRGYRFAARVRSFRGEDTELPEHSRSACEQAFTHVVSIDHRTPDAQVTSLAKRRMSGDPPSVESQRNYLIGRYLWNRMTERGLLKAIAFFERALSSDDKCSLGYVGIADACIRLGDLSLRPPSDTFGRAMVAAHRALAIRETPEAHASLALLRMYAYWDAPGAAREFERALELNPGYPTVHQWYGWFLLTVGRIAEAETALRIANDLDPISLMIRVMLGLCARAGGRLDEAAASFQSIIELDETFAPAHYCMALVEAQRDNRAQSERAFRCAQRLDPASPLIKSALAHYLARWGRVEESLKLRAQVARNHADGFECPYQMALIEGALGRTDEAFRWLQTASAQMSPYLLWMKTDAMLDPLRADSRLQSICDAVHFY